MAFPIEKSPPYKISRFAARTYRVERDRTVRIEFDKDCACAPYAQRGRSRDICGGANDYRNDRFCAAEGLVRLRFPWLAWMTMHGIPILCNPKD